VDTKRCTQKSLLVLEKMMQVVVVPVTPAFIVRSERERGHHHHCHQGVYNSTTVLVLFMHIYLLKYYLKYVSFLGIPQNDIHVSYMLQTPF